MRNLRMTAVALTTLAASAVMAGEASAMPAADLAPPVQQLSGLQDVRWVCGPYRCWWQPGPYGWHRAYWGRPYWHPWHRHWW